MKKNDKQLGKPGILYKNTTAAIEALTSVDEGSIAYATDTDLIGTFNGVIWLWGSEAAVSGLHNSLDGIQGGSPDDYYHITQVQYSGLVGGEETSLHSHAAVAVSGANGHIIQEEGVSVTQRSKLNFVGEGVLVLDDEANDTTIVTISGTTVSGTTSSGTSYTDEQAQDAVGSILNTTLVYDDDAPSIGRATISGDVSVLAGSNVSTIQNDVVTNAKLAEMTSYTLKGNGTGATANPTDLTLNNVLDWKSAIAGAMLYRSASSWVGLTGPTATTQFLGVTYDAGTEVYLPEWRNGPGYVLQGMATNQTSTTDGQTVYWGLIDRLPTATAGDHRVYIPFAGTIKIAYIFTQSGTAGSGQDWSVYIRLNNTTDTLVQTIGSTSAVRVFTNTGLSIAVAQGDYIEIKEVHPTWTTNPVNIRRNFSIYVAI
jgi:hypothetical protein